jgi:hypothetical protein
MPTKAENIAADQAALDADQAKLSADEESNADVSDDEIIALQTKLDNANKTKAAARAKVVADAKSRGEPAPQPSRDGRFDNETIDGFRWSAASHSWIEFVGTDRTVEVPEGFVHVGDGSPEHPHDVRLSDRW